MSAAPQEPRELQYAPLAVEMAFTCQVEVNGVRGPLEIKAHSMNEIRRVLNLLKQNGLLVEQPQAHGTNGEPPVCPDHDKPMKKGQYGWFCPRKLEDGSYCKQRG